LPFKEPGTDSLRTINRLVDKVIEHRKVVPKGPISEYERRVDQAVYSMFGLTEDEIKRVEAEVFVKERGSQSSDEVELDSPE
jgi:hypothetical protein